MSKNRFVKPQVVRVDVSDGDWLDLKRELTVGEQRRAMSRIVQTMKSDGQIVPNMEQVGKAELAAYIVGWSFTRDGEPVPYSEDALDALSVDAFKEVEQAIRQHIERIEAERKNS